MPKIVDHRARRTQIAEALMRVAARDGLLLVSLRHVAGEAGVSMGMVQHYFRTKDEMFSFAIDVVSENVQQRLARRAADLGENPSPRQVVEGFLNELLPVDGQRRLEGHVGLAYAAYTAVRPEIAAEMRRQTQQLREFLAGQIRAARGDKGELDPSPEVTAIALFSLVEGLSLHVLGGHLTGEQAQAALDNALTAAFPSSKPTPEQGAR